jgi:hypothetical protein
MGFDERSSYLAVNGPNGLFAVTATSAVDGLIAKVVERSLAGIDFRLAIRLAASGPESGSVSSGP